MEYSIHYSEVIIKRLAQLNLQKILPRIAIKHILSILTAMFSAGYRGKTVDFSRHSENHRTTVAHFLNHGKWDDGELEKILRRYVIETIYAQARRSGKPVFAIADDTISSKTKPSSKAMHPIEAACFHHSHLKRKKDYGHQAISVMLSCNGITLNYAVVMYDKTTSKIQLLCDPADELPEPPVPSCFLCDSWYTCGKVMDSFIKRGFYTIGALKTNRIIFPGGIRQQVSQFATYLRKTDQTVRLVTVAGRQDHVCRYEGKLNDVDNAVVLICYPKDAFGNPNALRVFLSTDDSLPAMEILENYVQRWAIEVCFRDCKTKPGFDQCQIRSAQGIRRL